MKPISLTRRSIGLEEKDVDSEGYLILSSKQAPFQLPQVGVMPRPMVIVFFSLNRGIVE